MTTTGKPKGASGRSYRGGGAQKPHKGKRTASSRRWIERQLNDPFVAEAKARGFRSRSALKLEQIDKKHGLFKKGGNVLDLGCAPGGWLQYAAMRIGARGTLVGVDLLATDPVGDAHIIKGDINDDTVLAELTARLDGRADVVLSDMAADTTGHRATDHLRTTALFDLALDTATRLLTPGGVFLAKVFKGGAEAASLNAMRRNFGTVRHVKPAASRKESPETYVLATGWLATGWRGGDGEAVTS